MPKMTLARGQVWKCRDHGGPPLHMVVSVSFDHDRVKYVHEDEDEGDIVHSWENGIKDFILKHEIVSATCKPCGQNCSWEKDIAPPLAVGQVWECEDHIFDHHHTHRITGLANGKVQFDHPISKEGGENKYGWSADKFIQRHRFLSAPEPKPCLSCYYKTCEMYGDDSDERPPCQTVEGHEEVKAFAEKNLLPMRDTIAHVTNERIVLAEGFEFGDEVGLRTDENGAPVWVKVIRDKSTDCGEHECISEGDDPDRPICEVCHNEETKDTGFVDLPVQTRLDGSMFVRWKTS